LHGYKKESRMLLMTDRVGQQLGNYRLLRLLGQGGFAEVYLAEHLHLKVQVAIKLLYGKLTPQHIQAFLTEAQTIATLKHPHILRVLDFGFEQALPFLVMDYAPGGTLRERHPGGSLLALPTVIAYARQIATALEYAHARKFIHRDVKPENMLIDADGNVLLGDFGIVAVAHSTASMQTIDTTGTVHYMAPEQINGKPRPASDQYALAIVVYEWLCGERPFRGSSPIEIAMQQLSADPPRLQHKNASVPAEVEQVVLKALAKDPQRRFADIQQFIEALEQACTDQAPRIRQSAPSNSIVSPSQFTPFESTEQPQQSPLLAGRQFLSGAVPSAPSPMLSVARNWVRGKGVAVSFVARFSHNSKEEKNAIESVAWSPDSQSLACASGYKRATIWNVLTGHPRLDIPDGSNQLVWSSDGRRVFSLSFRAITILDAVTGTILHSFDICQEKKFLATQMAVFPDETRVAVVVSSTRKRENKDQIHVFDIRTDQTLLIYQGHNNSSYIDQSLICLPGSRYIVSSSDKGIQIWDGVKGNTVVTYDEHAPYGVSSIAASPDGKRIASYALGGMRVWDTRIGKTLVTTERIDSTYIKVLAWSPDGKYIATAGDFEETHIRDASTGQSMLEYRREIGYAEQMKTIAWSPDGKYIAFGSSEGLIQVWEVKRL
jgi:serine/threonine protein kinase